MARREMRAGAAVVVATFAGVAVAVGSVASAAPAKSKPLTRARAEAAIAKKVKSAYRSQVGEREVQVGCKRVTSRRYRCEYGVLTLQSDETDDQDRDPYRYEGTGSVKKPRHGRLIVRVSRPR